MQSDVRCCAFGPFFCSIPLSTLQEISNSNVPARKCQNENSSYETRIRMFHMKHAEYKAPNSVSIRSLSSVESITFLFIASENVNKCDNFRCTLSCTRNKQTEDFSCVI